MAIADSLVMELEREAATTKRVLERVPNDKLSWKPHPKSMSLGQLALHVAETPGFVADMASRPIYEVSAASFEQRAAGSAAELLPALEQSINKATTMLKGMDDGSAMSMWKAVRNGKEVFSAPRVGVVRTIMLNHWYHHRGQLSVYLRLLGVPVPSIYGPSADENPFE